MTKEAKEYGITVTTAQGNFQVSGGDPEWVEEKAEWLLDRLIGAEEEAESIPEPAGDGEEEDGDEPDEEDEDEDEDEEEDEDEDDRYDDMKLAELRQEARDRGVSARGNRQDVIDRLRGSDGG